MPEGENPTPKGETPDLAELQRQNAELRAQIRELNAEARDHRLERNDARRVARELEAQLKELQKQGGSAPSEELESLRRENRQLKHRGVFERVARETGARTSGKALDALWDALKYDADGDADPADLKAKIEAVKADYDFLFDGQPPASETPAPKPEAKPEIAPPKPPGPGVSRGRAADGANMVRVRKSDLQSFDPRVNPLLDRYRAAEVKKAQAESRLQYIDE